MKWLPDILTLARVPLALVIALLGLAGRGALDEVIMLLMAGWTIDQFDGRIARRYKEEKTWIGENDIFFDLIMVLGSLAYLGLAGFIPLWLALGYVGLAGLCTAFFHSSAVIRLFETPLLPLPFVFAFFKAPEVIYRIFLPWSLISLILNWRRAMETRQEAKEDFKSLLLHIKNRW